VVRGGVGGEEGLSGLQLLASLPQLLLELLELLARSLGLGLGGLGLGLSRWGDLLTHELRPVLAVDEIPGIHSLFVELSEDPSPVGHGRDARRGSDEMAQLFPVEGAVGGRRQGRGQSGAWR
jgi:hypothetical protein